MMADASVLPASAVKFSYELQPFGRVPGVRQLEHAMSQRVRQKGLEQCVCIKSSSEQ